MIKYSVIIPTYINNEGVQKCIDSIYEFTDLFNVEIILVANGSPESIREYVKNKNLKNKSIRLLWYKNPIGYTKASNAGIKASKGKYVILLNDDTVLLEQKENDWLKMLEKPFLDNSKMGITGPSLVYCPFALEHFMIFFCVMIKKELFEKLGLLDEVFNPGFGEDTDFSIKAVKSGYRLKQVPDNNTFFSDENKKVMTGNFPIFHEGEKTIDFLNENSSIKKSFNIDGKGLINKNRITLCNRYGKGRIKLNIGCGDRLFDGYVNIDLYNPLADLFMDFCKLELEDNSVKEIVGIHIFEHIMPQNIIDVLKDWNRILVPGGKLCLEMPDLLKTCKHFEKSSKEKRYKLTNIIYGINGGHLGQTHYFGWYDEILVDHLLPSGYENIEFKEPRFDGWGYNLRVEATKPK